MKKILVSTVIILLFAAFVSEAAAETGGETVYETRAVWAPERDIDSPQDVDKLIAMMKSANLNVLLPCVFCHGDVYFKNRLLEMNPNLPEGYDPLAYMVEKAHAAGIEVHPWFCVTYIGVRGAEGGGFLLRYYPQFGAHTADGADWAAADSGGGLYANVHNAEYRDFMVDLMSEMVRDYDVDGLHYDYIRAASASFDPESSRAFEQKFGHTIADATYDEKVEWFGPAVDDIVKRAAEKARGFRPDVIVTAAVFTQIAFISKQGQDSIKWAKNGWVDTLFTMDYEMSSVMIRMNEMDFKSRLNKRQHGVGLSTYQHGADGKVENRPPELVLGQIKTVLKLGVRQFAFFASCYIDEKIGEAMIKWPFRKKAIPYFRKPAEEKE